MSKVFTNRLTDALQPLFRKEFEREGIEKLRSSLYDIMHRSVQIRSELLVGTDHYEIIWPSVGSSFEGAEMEMNSSEPITVANMVRLPICPGIRAYTRGKAMVDYRGLAMDKPSSQCPKYVVKALILR
jgi:hypothetical protein